MFRLVLTFMLFVSPVLSAPPVVGSDDWEIMHDYREWIETQHTQFGAWCCTVADGRPVDARVHEGHWQIFVTEEKFPRSPRGWTDVPDAAVVREPNPVGVPIAWVLGGRVLCFAPSSGI